MTQPNAIGAAVQSPWHQAIGPVYLAVTVCQLLGISEAVLQELVDGHQALVLTTSDDVAVFPAYQFKDGRIMTGWSQVVAAIMASADAAYSWTWASLVVKRPFESLGRRSILEWLIEGHDPNQAMRAVEHQVAHGGS